MLRGNIRSENNLVFTEQIFEAFKFIIQNLETGVVYLFVHKQKSKMKATRYPNFMFINLGMSTVITFNFLYALL